MSRFDDPDPEYIRWLGRYVRETNDMWIGLSTFWRLALSPFYIITFAWWCVKGEDVVVKRLYEDGYDPDE